MGVPILTEKLETDPDTQKESNNLTEKQEEVKMETNSNGGGNLHPPGEKIVVENEDVSDGPSEVKVENDATMNQASSLVEVKPEEDGQDNVDFVGVTENAEIDDNGAPEDKIDEGPPSPPQEVIDESSPENVNDEGSPVVGVVEDESPPGVGVVEDKGPPDGGVVEDEGPPADGVVEVEGTAKTGVVAGPPKARVSQEEGPPEDIFDDSEDGSPEAEIDQVPPPLEQSIDKSVAAAEIDDGEDSKLDIDLSQAEVDEEFPPGQNSQEDMFGPEEPALKEELAEDNNNGEIIDNDNEDEKGFVYGLDVSSTTPPTRASNNSSLIVENENETRDSFVSTDSEMDFRAQEGTWPSTRPMNYDYDDESDYYEEEEPEEPPVSENVDKSSTPGPSRVGSNPSLVTSPDSGRPRRSKAGKRAQRDEFEYDFPKKSKRSSQSPEKTPRGSPKKVPSQEQPKTKVNDELDVGKISENSTVAATPGPKKRGRKPKTPATTTVEPSQEKELNEEECKTENMDVEENPEDLEVPVTSVPPKKRGRKPKSIAVPSVELNEDRNADNVDDPEESEKEKSTPGPKKRGRKPRASVSVKTMDTSEVKEEENDDKNDELENPPEDTEAPTIIPPPKKRGRKPRASTTAETLELKEEENPPESESEEPPPVIKPPPKKRGRKPNATASANTSVTTNDDETLEISESSPPKKRGRQSNSNASVATPRGRKVTARIPVATKRFPRKAKVSEPIAARKKIVRHVRGKRASLPAQTAAATSDESETETEPTPKKGKTSEGQVPAKRKYVRKNTKVDEPQPSTSKEKQVKSGTGRDEPQPSPTPAKRKYVKPGRGLGKGKGIWNRGRKKGVKNNAAAQKVDDELDSIPLTTRVQRNKFNLAGRPKRKMMGKKSKTFEEEYSPGPTFTRKPEPPPPPKKVKKVGPGRPPAFIKAPTIKQPLAVMCMEAIRKTQSYRGATLFSVKKYMAEKYKYDVVHGRNQIVNFIGKAIQGGVLFQVSGVLARGRFRVPTRNPVHFPQGVKKIPRKISQGKNKGTPKQKGSRKAKTTPGAATTPADPYEFRDDDDDFDGLGFGDDDEDMDVDDDEQN